MKRKEEEKLKPVSLFCDSTLERRRFREILEEIPSAVVVVEKPEGKITYANKRALELHGVNPCGLSINEHVAALKIFTLDGKLCQTNQLPTYRALFGEENLRDVPLVIERPDGNKFFVNVAAKPLYDKQGNVRSAIAIFDDVSERFKTQEFLKESEERLNMAQKIAHVGNWEYNVKEDRAIWSEELFQIFGLRPQTYGPNLNEYVAKVHPDDREPMNKIMEKMLFSGGLATKASFDYRIVLADGSTRTIHSERFVREFDADQKPARIVGVEQDVTERKLIEHKLEQYAKNLEQLVEERTRQLKNVERLATIGETAGMIGHDIRNPLQAIDGDLFLMKQEVDASADSSCKRVVQESLASIQEQVDYINKIVSDLQDYARPLNPDFQEIDLCEVIPRLIATVKIPNSIDLTLDCKPDLPLVKLDLTFLKRIFVNLVTNSVQAMPSGGKLSIKSYQENQTVNILVSDTGVGIPEAMKPKIFQPLMTTKSKGQGFGLVAVKRLVETQGGTITFKSEEGRGTEFKIIFPASKINSFDAS